MTAALLLPASYLLVACCTCVGAFLGFVVGLLVMLPRLHRTAARAYAAGAADARDWREKVTLHAAYVGPELHPGELRLVKR